MGLAHFFKNNMVQAQVVDLSIPALVLVEEFVIDDVNVETSWLRDDPAIATIQI